MAMSFSARAEGDSELMLDINTTPLIDVMLVLIIMLIITIPVQLHQLQLGRAGPPQTEPAGVTAPVERVELLADGRVNWNGAELADRGALEAELLRVAAIAPQPQVLLRPDSRVAYQHVAAVLAAARRFGVNNLGLVGHERLAP